MKIKVLENCGYLVTGSIPLLKQVVLEDNNGVPIGFKTIKEYPLQESYILCRCGKSKNIPFCDNEHSKTNFFGKETAKKYVSWKEYEGDGLILYDALDFCYGASFCHLGGGAWNLIAKSDKRLAKELAIKGAMGCPSGRLVIKDKEKDEILEPSYEPSIVIIEEEDGIWGPIFVRGNIPVESANGELYTIRNRVTLCRCGKSNNKPFCDGAHYNL